MRCEDIENASTRNAWIHVKVVNQCDQESLDALVAECVDTCEGCEPVRSGMLKMKNCDAKIYKTHLPRNAWIHVKVVNQCDQE